MQTIVPSERTTAMPHLQQHPKMCSSGAVTRRCSVSQTIVPPYGCSCPRDAQHSNFLNYINDIPNEVRSSLATYFSTGDSQSLRLNEENFHAYFHTGALMQRSVGVMEQCVQFLTNCANHSTVLRDIRACRCDCADVLQREMNNSIDSSSRHSCAEKEKELTPEFAVLFLARADKEKRQKIVAVDVSSRVSSFSSDAERVGKFGPGFAACSVDIGESPYVLVSGGQGKNAACVSKYDVIMGQWEKSHKMNHKRECHMMATVEDKVYVFGGGGTKEVEEFDPTTNSCKSICTLVKCVSSAPYAVHGKLIYIFGGVVSGNQRVATVQCIDTINKTCFVLPDLPTRCSDGQAVVINNTIFLASGQGHMVRFSVDTGKSELCAQQLSCRNQFVLFVREQSIFILGGVTSGCHGDKDADTICQYSPERDSWAVYHTLTSPLRIYTSCLVRYSRKCPIVPFCPCFQR